MSDNSGSGGGALETHHHYINGGFGPPSSGKDPFCPTTTNGGHLTDISGDTHLTLLKSNPGLNSFSFVDGDGMGSRLPDAFMEMRYVDLGIGSWDLAGYTAEGLTSRLIDNRSLTDSPDNIIQYRPWEKPDSSSPAITTTSSPSHMNLAPNGNGVMTSATSNGKSPTLTTLTNAFPTFSDTFGPLNGQKPLPSFQSQFNSFSEPPPAHHTNGNHHGNNGDINHPHPATTGPPSLPSFHTLPANHRGYVHQGQPTLLASGPVHRDLPNIQPQFLDDRHIQLFPVPGQILAGGPPVTNPGIQINGNGQHFVTTTNNLCGPPGHHFVGGAPPSQLVELVSMPPMQLHSHYPHPPAHPHTKPQTTDGSIPGLNLNDLHHHTQNGNMNLNLNGPPSGPGGKYGPGDGPNEPTVIAVKISHGNNYEHQQQLNNHSMHPHHLQHQQHTPQSSPQIVTNSTPNGNGLPNHQHHNNLHSTPNNTNGPTPKRQQKRKRNAESMDNSAYQHHNNNHQHQNHNNSHNNNDLNNDAQVSSVSSSDSDFKRPNLGLNGNGLDDSGLDKPVKKKRKRCGECVGCQKKDNCGDCAPCRNEKSHQICKMRRCEKLTEKKNRVGRGMKQQQQQQH